METIKISLGFLELALALKFLSNVDLAYHWQWLDREVFLVLWIMITGCFSAFLLGLLRLSAIPEKIVVPRLFLGIIVGAFALYMLPGLWGAPLKSVAAFLPPQDTQDFDLYTPSITGSSVSVPEKVKYADLFHAPLGLKAFFDYQEGLAYARKVNKPILIDFTGHACVNCRKMEATVWPDKAVLPLIRDEYVLIQLYVDDKTATADGSTIGKTNMAIQAEKFNSNSQPFYVLLDPHSEKALVPPQGAEYDPVVYATFLKQGLEQYP
ncbi:MAG TPA: thioredoxin family protein [Mucilaginibacter sp.]|nr:thioredoxin family protein [Mucilaginibacter sp.]